MQKVLITGGSRGIGLATAKRFVEEGFKVIVIGRDFSSCPLGEDVTKVVFDLTEIEKIPELAKDIGAIDILVNAAGIINMQGFEDFEYPENKKREILQVNLEAPVALITEFSRSMINNGGGRIVNVTSVAGSTGHPDIWYGMTKAGLINATKSFAKILGKHGIVVTSVAPGPVNTDMLEQISKERLASLKANSVNGKFASPEQIAEIIYWLSTDAPDQVTGASIDANNCAYTR